MFETIFLLVICWQAVVSIDKFKQDQRKYDLAVLNRKSIEDRLVYAKIVDIELIDKEDGGFARWVTYEFKAPNGEEYSCDVISDVQRSIGDVNQMLMIFDDNGECCDLEYPSPLPRKPTIEEFGTNVMAIVFMLILLFMMSYFTGE